MRRRHSRASSAAVQSFHPPARPVWMCGTGPAGTVEDHCARLLSARVQWLDLPAALEGRAEMLRKERHRTVPIPPGDTVRGALA